MNIKIIGSLLALVLIVQVVLVGAGTKMSNNINSINAQQASILSSIRRIIDSDEQEPGGFTFTYNTYYLYNRCTTTTITYDDVTGAVTNVSTSSGYQVSTPNGLDCQTSVVGPNNNDGNIENAEFIQLKNGIINIENSSDITSSQIKFIK